MIDDISPPGSWAKELAARPHTISDVWQALRDAESALARAEADAARYRWLRRRNHMGLVDPLGPYAVIDNPEEGQCFPSAKELDAAIDAARGAP